MFPKIIKWAALSALLVAIAVRRLAPEYAILPQLLIFIGASAIFLQNLREKQYGWATAFVVIAVLFNPILIFVPIQDSEFFLMAAACMTVFAFALETLKTTPTLSIPSITDTNPGRESL